MASNTEDSLIEKFADDVTAQNPLHTNFMRTSVRGLDAQKREKLAGYIEYCLKSGLTMSELVNAYNTITLDTQAEQNYFRKHRSYRWSKFSEVAEKVYFDPAYMKKYMYGLALTSFLWPNHAAIHDFFTRTFPKDARGTYLEVGPGHGYYFMEAARLGKFEKLTGVDISASSIAMTRDIIQHFGMGGNHEIELNEADFLDFNAPKHPYSCIVMGEVLEHVEAPADFLRKLADLSSSETHVYVTTCVNAPAVDHIYLFRHPEEIETMAWDEGLRVEDKFYAPYGNLSVEESISQQLPVNVAYTFRKR